MRKYSLVHYESEFSKDAKKVSEIDRIVGEQLQKNGMKMAPLCSDELFLRRVYLDMTGSLPSFSRINSFIKNKNPAKRSKLIDVACKSSKWLKEVKVELYHGPRG